MGNEFVKKISSMLDMPNACLKCNKEYDKKNKEMATSWKVKVYNNTGGVELFCPECFELENKKEQVNNE